MSAAAELFIRVSAEIADMRSKFTQVADQASKMASSIDGAGRDAADGLHRVETAGASLRDMFKANLGANIAADALQALGSAMFNAGKHAIGLAGELEQSKVAFTTMLGSASRADGFLKQLSTFAANTPFELRGLQDSSKRLLAFGFQAKDIIPIMTGVGNAVAGVGGGKEVLDGVTTALGQMSAKGKVSAEEMGQLAERGIPAWGMLAKAVGKSTAEVQADVTAGSVKATTAIEALVNGMNQRFPDMMAKQSKTLLGAWSNLTDGIDGFLTRIGMRIAETFQLTEVVSAMSRAFNMVSEALDEHNGVLGSINAAFGPTSRALILGIATAVTAYLTPAIMTSLVPAIMNSAIPAIRALALAWAPAIAAAAPYVGLAAAVAFAAYPIIKNWDTLGVVLREVWQGISNGAASMWNAVRSAFSRMMEGAWSLGKTIVDALKPIFDKLKPIWDKLPEGFRLSIGEVARTAYHLPGELAANIRAGNGPLLGAGKWAASQFTETWGDALSGARDVTGRIFGSIGQQTAAFGKTTAFHLTNASKAAAEAGKAATAAGDAAKKAGDVAHKALVAAEKAAKAYAEAVDRGGKAMEGFNQKLTVFANLGHGIKEADRLSAELGARFDANAAKADTYKAAVERLKSLGFQPTSNVVRQLSEQMDKLHEASEKGTKPIAAAYKVLDGATKKFEAARLKASLLGEAFDENKQRADAYRDAIRQMVDQGFTPGNTALEEARTNLAALSQQANNATLSFGDLKEKIGGLTGEMSTLGGNLSTIGQALGAGFLEAVGGAATKFASLGNAFLEAGKATANLGPEIVKIAGMVSGLAVPAFTALAGLVQATVIPTLQGMGFAAWGALGPFGQVAVVIGGAIIAGELLAASWEKISGFLSGVWVTLAGAATVAFTAVGDAVRGAWDGLVGMVKGSVNAIIAVINTLIRGMNRISIDVPSWVPGIGDRHFGVTIPQIPYLAAGGITTGPAMAMIGEGRHQEAVLPLSGDVFQALGRSIAGAMPAPAYAMAGGRGDVHLHVTYTGNGKWSRKDVEELGALLVGQIKATGARV